MIAAQPTSIPSPLLTNAQNLTPFEMFWCMKMAAGRRYADSIVVKGTFDLAPGKLERSEQQSAIVLVDEYWDTACPERSSVKHAGEALLMKPSTDVIVTGSARAPVGEARPSWYAAVTVEDAGGDKIIDHTLQVTGRRQWRHQALRGWVLGDPEPAVEVPIRYELAYGGGYRDRNDEWIVYEDNPSGRGFCDEAALDRDAAYDAPQWQTPDQPPSRIGASAPLAGLGPIMRPWASRLKYQGTCDAAWIERMRADIANGLPTDYPADFDARYFQCAHPALIAAQYLRGDEAVHLLGMSQEHNRLTMRLPNVDVFAWLQDADGLWIEQPLVLDTVHFDLEAGHVYLSWRITLWHEREVCTAIIQSEERE